MTRKKYCGTAAKAGGNGENKPRPKVMGVPCLLETAIPIAQSMWRWSGLGCLFLVAQGSLFAQQPTVSRTLAVGSGPVQVAFSPDGKILASATDDGVKLLDIGTGKHTATLEDDRGIWSMAFSPDGKTLALASGPFGMYGNPAMKEGLAPAMEDVLRKPAADEIRLWAVATAKSTAVLKSDAGRAAKK